ncbi:MAG: NAD(P)-dependent dehydrogenase (short-subunit alcohol dehydrogenase family), partial [Verrucomicrobiales bacterium]
MLPGMRLKDKVIIVTGSTQGIGEAIARRAVREGARVLIHGLEPELGEKVVADLGDAAVLQIDDLADPAVPARLVEKAVNTFGTLDCIVNNAAWVARSDLASTDANMFDRVMAINARAPMLLIQAGLKHLEASKGCVLNIGSVNAWSG